MKTFYFFRHGQTDWNLEKRWQGHRDIPLNKTGEQEAEHLGQKLRSKNLEVIYSSDLSRAFKTAQIVSKHCSVEVIKSSSLREIHMGEAQGLTHDDVAEKYGVEFFDCFKKVPGDLQRRFIPDGETKAEVLSRVRDYLEEVIQSPYKTIGISTHGGVLRNFIHQLIPHEENPIPVPNCSAYLLTFEPRNKIWSFLGQV